MGQGEQFVAQARVVAQLRGGLALNKAAPTRSGSGQEMVVIDRRAG